MNELSTRMSGLASAVKGLLGVSALAIAWIVLGTTAVQFFLANNTARRMDIVLSGGALGLGLLVVAGVVLVAERAWLATAAEVEADRRLAQALSEAAAARAGRGGLTALPERVLASAVSFHRSDCFLVGDGDGFRDVTLKTAQRRKLSPCKLCLRELA